MICTDCDGFPEAYQKVVGCGASRINVPSGNVDQQTGRRLQRKPLSSCRTWTRNLRRSSRLAGGQADIQERISLQRELLTWYLKGSNILKKLEQDVPIIYERIVRFTQDQAESISH